MSGRFISLEGVEGVGKSTNLLYIVSYLRDQGIEVVQTREPGGTEVGERIREVLLDPALEIGAEAELLLMFASRGELVRSTIKPALADGQWVVSDRFADASYAYQGGGRQLGFAAVAEIEHHVLGEFCPDRTLFLDLPVEIGLERLSARGDKDRIEREQVSFFQRVRDAYWQRVNKDPERFCVIDASGALPAVQVQIKAVLDHELSMAAECT